MAKAGPHRRDRGAEEHAMAAFLARARAERPDIAVDDRAFADHVAAQIGDAEDPIDELAQLHAGDLRLAFACAQGDASALTVFERDHLEHTHAAHARMGPQRPEFGEFRQLVLAHAVAPRDDGPPAIASYS